MASSRPPAPERPRAARTTVRDPEAVLLSVADPEAPRPRNETSPLLAIVPTRIRGLRELGDKLNVRAAWVLAHVDGHANVATIVKRCELPADEVLEVLRELTLLDAVDTP